MKKTTIHLVRHGEVHNPKQVFYGRIPGFRLSERGKEQVQRLGKHLSTRPVKTIYASPLDRTKETAQILSTYFPEIALAYDERLIEVGSPLQGRSMEGLADVNFNFYKEPYLSQGGETIEDIAKRMKVFVEEHAIKHQGEEIIVVSHGDPIMITRAMYKKEPLTIETLRQGFYVNTAHGIEIMINEETITVMDITPTDQDKV